MRKVDDVVIVGGGPVGLFLATALSYHGVSSTILERNELPTKWPKMDLTNARSMEILAQLGLADSFRQRGVPPQYEFDVLFSTGLSERGVCLAKWELPSVNRLRREIKATNDGSMPREPWQRASQAIFEEWLRELCNKDPMITLKTSISVTHADQSLDSATTYYVDLKTGEKSSITSRYAIGCDGAASAMRKSTTVKMHRLPPSGPAALIHFRSRDPRLRTQGRFWHIFLTTRAAIISQDEEDTYTIHKFMAPNGKPPSLDTDPLQEIHEALNCDIRVDEITIHNIWKPNFCVADKYQEGRIILVGDAIRQVAPLGGYGFNGSLSDCFDLAWKLAGVLRGWAAPLLLSTFEIERRPVAKKCMEWSYRHMGVHGYAWGNPDVDVVYQTSPEGEALRVDLSKHFSEATGENDSWGIEMGQRYEDSPILQVEIKDQDETPEFHVRNVPTFAYPGCRAPHVWLSDGKSIFEHYHPGFTLFSFVADPWVKTFGEIGRKLNVPCKIVELNDDHAAQIWGKKVVLVRPDGIVAYRTDELPSESAEMEGIWERVTGWQIPTQLKDRTEETTLHDVVDEKDIDTGLT